VTGTYVSPRGDYEQYSANDPALAEWVHIAFTDAFLRSYEAFHGPVPGGADRYVAEWATAGELMGIADPPRTEAALADRIRAYDAAGQLSGGPRVDDVVAFIRRPPLDPLLKPGFAMLFGAVLDTLPPRHLELLGLSRPRLGPVPLPLSGAAKATLAVVGRALGPMAPSEAAARRRLARLGVL
jgi:uncharacterized protein (DUF2236 family)